MTVISVVGGRKVDLLTQETNPALQGLDLSVILSTRSILANNPYLDVIGWQITVGSGARQHIHFREKERGKGKWRGTVEGERLPITAVLEFVGGVTLSKALQGSLMDR
ncbi:hypothetical protein PAXINDRAFT_157894 [Paxillus involutus ATCC 200175]|uniref:Uncharacterized protein n=1 Tax=Paxillus involutus ATCC 200175 TaxID=664439 RepID=A0A0C9T0W8_PAXIN|nr:hypothetical protein PAXINDRAFT_157894 [Paxillus involutus ATCC 200175]